MPSDKKNTMPSYTIATNVVYSLTTLHNLKSKKAQGVVVNDAMQFLAALKKAGGATSTFENLVTNLIEFQKTASVPDRDDLEEFEEEMFAELDRIYSH